MSLIRNFALHQRLGQTVHKTLPRTRTGLLTTTRATSSSPQPHTSTNKMAEKKKVLIEITSDTVW